MQRDNDANGINGADREPQQSGGGRLELTLAKVHPDSFDMEAAIRLWEKLTGKTFVGDSKTGIPDGYPPEPED